jgi:hypothetical protein
MYFYRSKSTKRAICLIIYRIFLKRFFKRVYAYTAATGRSRAPRCQGRGEGIVSTPPQRNRCRNHWKVLIVVGAYQILHTCMGELLS